MKSFNEIFPSWTEALGWTLLNSLWQGLFITILVIFLLRIIPSRSSQLRYVMSCGAMMLLVSASFITFIILIEEPENALRAFTLSFANQSSEIFSSSVSDLTPVEIFQ